MKNEIERKFFVKEMPDISNIQPLHYERYFLKRENGVEERVSKINEKYVYEKKHEISNLERTRDKKEISAEEFNLLKRDATEVLIRDRYDLSENPKISIQIYQGKFKGLVRAEIEFDSEEDAKKFRPFVWMGSEMTDLPIARDSKLLDLSESEFKRLLV
ncbi:MAG: hypothetical protein KGI69_03065 [Patescibacteria group bacterium]|nr:hypothetical protein [Patescibacteria group bacterium]